ncbi:MAG: AI-2E family transporter, partial [Chloroflexota bacterium]
ISAFLVVVVMFNGSSILIPIVIAIGVWLVLNDIITYIHNLKIGTFQIPRPMVAIFGLIITFFLLLRVIGLFLENLRIFLDAFPQYSKNLNDLLSRIPESVWLGLFGEEVDLSVGIVDHLFTYASDYFTSYITIVASDAATLASNAVYIAVYVIFLFLEQGTFSTKAYNMFKNHERRQEFQTIMESIHSQVQTYITVKTLVSLITAVISFVIMMLFDLNHAIIWAMLIFILNFIPNIGSIIAIIFPVTMGLLQFGTFGPVVGLLTALGLVQVAVGYFVEPRMMGNQLNISPFVVLVALTVFGAIWGVVGMFLSVPLTVMLMIVFSHFDSTRPIAVLLSGDGVVHGIETEDI